MRSNKYLVMQINGDSATFVNSNFSGGRCALPTGNTTKFRPYDVPYKHENDTYWNSSEDLLVGFCRWYKRVDEKEAYHMGNRIYSASNTYRFFRSQDDIEMLNANVDLASYEISEETFITEMLTSWAFEQVSGMFAVKDFVYHRRTKSSPIKLDVVFNKETDTWCWYSDYLNFEPKDYLEVSTCSLLVRESYEVAMEDMVRTLGEYRFGGNDEYNKKKAMDLLINP